MKYDTSVLLRKQKEKKKGKKNLLLLQQYLVVSPEIRYKKVISLHEGDRKEEEGKKESKE